MERRDLLQNILVSNKTVFTFTDLMTMSDLTRKELQRKIKYMLAVGDLHHIRRGIYSKDTNYNKLELANKLVIPSYISFETVLRSAGVIFQYYSQIFCASYKSTEIELENQNYVYRTIKKSILLNPAGIILENNYSIASPERALLDIIYLNNDYYFDNLLTINWEKIYEILPIYGNNRRMKKLVKKYHDRVKEEIG